jgi:hypothetical protein
MAGTEKSYRRLPGKGVAAFQHVRLYQGADHLLQIASTGYSESYRRFYFRDIQAITIQKSNLGKILNGIFGFLIAVFGLPAFDMSLGPAIGMWSIAGFFALLLISNIILGPTCVCYVRTAVQTERLNAVTRIGTACRLLRRIRPLIEAVQGPLSQQEFALRLRSSGSTPGAGEAPPVVSPQSAEAPPPVIGSENSQGQLG